MGKTFSTGLLTNGVFQDTSNNIGIGAAPSGTYKLEVTGTAKVSSTLLVSGASTLTGAVGVGITAPSSGLEVYQSAGGATLRVTNSGTGTGSGNGFHIGTDGSSPYNVSFVQNENASQVFYTNNGTSTDERLRITSGGDMYLTGRSTNGDYGMYFYSNDTDSRIYSSNSGAVSKPLQFYTAGTERMRITSVGDVCITATAAKNPDGYDSNRTFLTVQAKTGGVDRGAYMTLVGTAGGTANYWLGRYAFASTTATYNHACITSLTDAGAYTGMLSFCTNSNASTGDAPERMRITSGGNVLIGTTSDFTGNTLQVGGGNIRHYLNNENCQLAHAGAMTVANGGTKTLECANGGLVFVSENNTGDGALFFCTYASATITLIADPNGHYAATNTAGRACLYKSANTGVVTFINNLGSSRSFTIYQIKNSD